MADTDLQAETPKTTGVTDDTLFFGALTGAGEAVADTIAGSAVTEYMADALPAAGAVREILTAHRTYYVRTDGDNDNDGLTDTAGGAWLTGQYGLEFVGSYIDLGGYTITLQFADGTYPGITLGDDNLTGFVGGGFVQIQGNLSDVTAVSIGGPGLGPDGFGVALNCSTIFAISDVTLSANSNVCLGVLNFSTMIMGRVANASGGAGGGNLKIGAPGAAFVTAIVAAYGATLLDFTSEMTIATGNCAGFLLAIHGVFAQLFGVTTTIVDTPAYSRAFVTVQGDSYLETFVTIGSGSCTGKRFKVDSNGAINAFGQPAATHYPGDAPGTLESGGAWGTNSGVGTAAAIATTATEGFAHVPRCAGPPTGTPALSTSGVPIVVDTSNNKLYFYSSGAWRDAGP